MAVTRINWRGVVVAFCIVLVTIDAALLTVKWPFTRKAVIKQLSHESGGPVSIREFHQTFFPRPVFVARGLVIHIGNGGGRPLVTVDQVKVTGKYAALLTFSKDLNEIHTRGMHISIPSKQEGSAREGKENSSVATIRIDRFVADAAILEFLPKQRSDPPFVIRIYRTVLAPASATAPMSFETSVRVPEPPGDVQAKGIIGPWNRTDPFQTAVSGTYTFQKADLGHFSGIAGTLTSRGRFQDVIAHIGVNGIADVPDFSIRRTSHRIHLETKFRATVDGSSGDVMLDEVAASFLRTEVQSSGAISAPGPDTAKHLTLNLVVPQGRIQDLLLLVSSGAPGLSGNVSIRFKVHLPPGDAPFLKRLKLTGEMGVKGGRFRNPETQETLERLAKKALEPETDPADVVSDLRGRFFVSGGVATLTGITFRVTGAS